MAEHQKYRITERIDAGGMAEVFRGVAESLQGFKKNVAIKRILPHIAKNKKFIQMFLDEARLSLHLQHANIVGVFDIGVSPPGKDGEGGTYFIVMEFVDGAHLKGIVESLRRQGRTLTLAQVLYIMMQVCSGLAYAHDVTDPETGRPLGIVHRDISPPNILISKNGEVKLVDFGLAKATSQLESTDPGVVKGKFSYLSPEAALGKEVDRRADIFAVGILMYELLTGKRLFFGENDYQTVELVRQARVPSLRAQNPEVDDELEAIVRRSLARDANSRYQTAGELQDAIAQYLFAHSLKVTSRDISTMVQACVAERAKSQPGPVRQKSLIDTLILEELNKFTSIEDEAADVAGLGAQPLSPDELATGGASSGAHKPLVDPGDLIDTSSWSAELTGEGPAVARPASNRSAATPGSMPIPITSSPKSAPVRRATPPIVPAVARRTPPTMPQTRSASGATPMPTPARPPVPTPPSLSAEAVPSLADLLEGDSKRNSITGAGAMGTEPTTPGHPSGDSAGAGKSSPGKSRAAAIVVAVVMLVLAVAAGVLLLGRGH